MDVCSKPTLSSVLKLGISMSKHYTWAWWRDVMESCGIIFTTWGHLKRVELWTHGCVFHLPLRSMPHGRNPTFLSCKTFLCEGIEGVVKAIVLLIRVRIANSSQCSYFVAFLELKLSSKQRKQSKDSYLYP